ncbi:MAG: IS1634 family transposase [Bacteroidales bacterium]|nr:IS1634 family transposase [Bacteroidales bacterium]
MYLQFNKKTGKNGNIYSTVLLCEKYRKDGVPKTKTILNLTKLGLSNEIITSLKSAINKTKGELIDSNDIKIAQSFDYGYIYLIIKLMKDLRILETVHKSFRGNSNIIILMIIGKIITRGSKLQIFNWIKRNPSIAELLSIDLKTLKLDDLYYELGELSKQQDKVEKKWNLYHRNKHKNIFLYDITSTYFEGTQNELSAFGYNRDKKKGKMQITIGLITDSSGFPLKIQVFEGNVNDHKTVNEQLLRLRDLFKAEEIILVGDRGMRIRLNMDDLEEEDKNNISYISALSSSEIRALIKDNDIQLELFTNELVEIKKGNIRYILCSNPILEKEKGQTRESLKSRFEKGLIEIKQSWNKRRDKNITNKNNIKKGNKNKKLVVEFSQKKLDNYKYRVSSLQKRYKMTKFYDIKVENEKFEINYDMQAYQNEKLLDGKYIIESTVKEELMTTKEVRTKYKELQNVEHAFRDMKTELSIRPVFHCNEAQTRGHVLICMFSYAIIKEIEEGIYPWIKEYNKRKNRKLSYKDMVGELSNIKLNKLEIGYKIDKLIIPELTDIQKEILNVFNLKIEDMIKM